VLTLFSRELMVAAENSALAARATEKAKRHVRSGELLAEAGFYDQGFAHLVLAAEEIAVSTIRTQAREGNVSFDRGDAAERSVPYIDEEDLCDHAPKQEAFRDGVQATQAGMGLLGLASLAAAVGPESELSGDNSRGAAAFLGILLLIASGNDPFPPIIKGKDWESMKQAALYSGPRRPGRPLTEPPGREEYNALHGVVSLWTK